jgi:hypothetical protein
MEKASQILFRSVLYSSLDCSRWKKTWARLTDTGETGVTRGVSYERRNTVSHISASTVQEHIDCSIPQGKVTEACSWVSVILWKIFFQSWRSSIYISIEKVADTYFGMKRVYMKNWNGILLYDDRKVTTLAKPCFQMPQSIWSNKIAKSKVFEQYNFCGVQPFCTGYYRYGIFLLPRHKICTGPDDHSSCTHLLAS